MERQQIIAKVKLRIDEFGPFEEGEVFGSAQIESLLNDAANRFLLAIPANLPTPYCFAEYSTSGGDSIPLDDNTGYLILPSTFLKLVYFKMDSWERAVTEAISVSDPRYALQRNEYTRGNISKPVCVYRYKTRVGKILEYYSVPDNEHYVEEALCLVETLPEHLDDFLIDPFTWFTAYLLLDSRGEFDSAKACLQKMMDWVTLKTTA